MALLSILTPFRNAEIHRGKQACRSLPKLIQSGIGFLVNDHSTENEREALKDLLQDPGSHLPENKGK